ncbi:hypothetical protein B0T20DRAFT_6325 [Sordaria brevicollis]|uniref:Uncharacterized protein n=1 Tax=Sordaria brevicollis TaxID=83679 RepID=A0AAE0UFV0_SORBR|nr:hypothetical protein B0T20DRAFT_6325 [Sordaria brevicollis]
MTSSPAPSDYSDEELRPSRKESRGRELNVYDAVAGNVTLNVRSRSGASRRNDSSTKRQKSSGLHSSRDPRYAPEEVLFRRKGAPARYEENDIYWANENLPDAGRHLLPDSDLLKSIHGYTSNFYDVMALRLGPRCVIGSRTIDERSMDETALLAFGILLEEASREAMGKKGDLVLTEPLTDPKVPHAHEQALDTPAVVDQQPVAGDAPGATPEKRRRKKKRKIRRDDDVTAAET